MIRELGEEGFRQHKKDTFERGHRLHRVVEEFLETGSVPDIDEVDNYLLYFSVSLFLTDQTWPNKLADIKFFNRWRILSLSCIFFPLLG